MRNTPQELRYFLAGLALFCFVLILPFLILGKDAYLQIHDTLDDKVPALSNIRDEAKTFRFSSSVLLDTPQGGVVPRNTFLSPFHAEGFLFGVLPPFLAFLLNYLLVHGLAFAGMYGLLRNHVLKESGQRLPAMLIAASFGLIPVFTLFASYLGTLPFYAWSMLELSKEKPPRWAWALCFLPPFAGNLILTGMYAIGCALVFFVLISVIRKTIHWPVLIGACLMVAGTVCAEVNLFIHQFGGEHFESHRSLWKSHLFNLPDALHAAWVACRFGHYHSPGMQEFMLFPIIAVFVYALIRRKMNAVWLGCMALIALFSLGYGFFQWEGMKALEDISGFFREFTLWRVGFSLPFLWYASLGLAAAWLFAENKKLFSAFAWLLILFQLQHVARHQYELRKNYEALAGRTSYNGPFVPAFTWKEIFAEKLYADVKSFIAKDTKSYRTGSIGLLPSSAIFNRIRTVDGYYNLYPKTYRLKMKAIMAEELKKSGIYDEWGTVGNHLYLHSSDLFKQYAAHSRSWDEKDFFVPYVPGDSLTQPAYDYKELKSMGCDYLLSAFPFRDANPDQLTFLKSFQSDETPVRIFLYELK